MITLINDMETIDYSSDINGHDLERVNLLLQQLNPDIARIDEKTISNVQKNGIVFTARNGKGELVGMASLIIIKKFSSTMGSCEDVVVDDAYRGHGIGKALMENLIRSAKELNLTHIDLTSNPSREAANNLYQKLGFEKRETNTYRMKL